MRVLHDHIRTHGAPAGTLQRQAQRSFQQSMPKMLTGGETQFARAANLKLGIECIPATPRRQGSRGARNQTLQDRWSRNAAGWHKQYGTRQRMAAGYHCGLNRARCGGAKKTRLMRHWPTGHLRQKLVRTLSVQMTRPVENLSCQYEKPLLPIKTTGTRGLRERRSRCTEQL